MTGVQTCALPISLILIGTKIREKAEILDIPLHKLGGPELPYHVVAIKRGSETLIPRGDDTIKLHDIVYLSLIHILPHDSHK